MHTGVRYDNEGRRAHQQRSSGGPIGHGEEDGSDQSNRDKDEHLGCTRDGSLEICRRLPYLKLAHRCTRRRKKGELVEPSDPRAEMVEEFLHLIS